MSLMYDTTVSLRFQEYFTHIINLNDQHSSTSCILHVTFLKLFLFSKSNDSLLFLFLISNYKESIHLATASSARCSVFFNTMDT